MAFSYSFHLSTKGNSLSTASKVSGTSRHNLRQYESKDYDRSQIEILQGSDSIMNDVRGIYQKEFDATLREYNSKVRPDRQIDDYLKSVSDKKQTDVACEIIVQVGDMDFWQDKSLDERKQMTDVFKGQLEDMKELVPDFKIASAVIHYDEKSPHMHVVGVPVHEGYKKGLNKQVSKTKVFTKDSLSMLQDKMRERVEDRMKDMDIFKDMELKAKERGRNKDYRKEELAGLYDLQEQEKEKQEHIFELDSQLREKNQNVRRLDKERDEIKADIDRLNKELEGLKNAKSNADDQIKAYDLISKKAEKHKIPPIEIGSQNVSDGLFKSHTEYFVKIPCKDEKAAQRRLNEVKAIYTKNFTKEDLQEQIEDIAHDVADTRQLWEDTHKRIRQESDTLDLAKKQAKAEIAQAKAAAKDAFIADTQIYKNLNFEKMGYSQNSLGRLVSNEIAQTLVRDAVYQAYDWLKQNGCLKQDKLLNKSKAAMASIKNLGTDISSFEDRVKKNMIKQLANDERMIDSVLKKGKSMNQESQRYYDCDFER